MLSRHITLVLPHQHTLQTELCIYLYVYINLIILYKLYIQLSIVHI